MSEETKRNGLFKRSIETSLLVDRLSKCQAGDTVTYRALGDLLGRPVSGATSQLQSAKRIVLAECSLYFDVDPGIGLICVGNDGRLASAEDGVKRIHRISSRKLKILGTAKVEEMTNDEKLRFNALASHLGVLSNVTTHGAQKKLAAAVAESQQCLPVAKTLEAFK